MAVDFMERQIEYFLKGFQRFKTALISLRML